MPVLPSPPASAPAPSVLIADDQPDVLEALRLLLKGEGFEVETVTSSGAALAALERRDFDALLMDMNYARDTTSGQEGLGLLQRLKELEPDLPVAVMTAWGSVGGAVEAMRRGAHDYIEKPWDNARLLVTLRNLVELGRALRRTRRLDAENRLLRGDGRAGAADGRGDGPPPLIAESPKMRPVLELIQRVGPSDANVLVTGEHGTGKELVAQWLHASSPRAARSFIPINMGGLSEGVFESELFGHVKGAFTDAKADRVGRFELADGGTIFLDEVANITLSQQAKLLRVLQTGDVERVGSSRPRRVDVRVVSATNADLQQEVEAGRFREDLLFRLNTIEIRLPPLRERREDVPVLATHFLRRHATRYRKSLSGFEPGAMQLLLAHTWPGNIRELDHAIERAVLLAQGDTVRAADFALRAGTGAAQRLEDLPLEDVERLLIQKALSRYGGNVSQAAKALGLSRSALYRRIASHGL
jgi:DNA-binding NtrC family response regulator